MPAKLGDTHFERKPGSGRVLIEDDRDTARPVEGTAAQRILFHFGGQRKHLGLFVGRQVVVAQEVSGHWPPSTVSKMPGNAVTKVSS